MRTDPELKMNRIEGARKPRATPMITKRQLSKKTHGSPNRYTTLSARIRQRDPKTTTNGTMTISVNTLKPSPHLHLTRSLSQSVGYGILDLEEQIIRITRRTKSE